MLKTKTGLLQGVCAMGVLSGLCAGAGAQDFKGFPDVPKDHWAAQAVNDLARRGILQGYPGEPSGGKLKTKPQSPQNAPASAKKPAARDTSAQKRK